MLPGQSGSIPLFRWRGIQVYLHWVWFLWAYYQISTRSHTYSSIYWSIAEYLSLFLIVLLHEFGHVLACRQVGGKADQIVLWPLGGVAYVQPPHRAAAELWTIAAGPLVNVVLFPLLMLAVRLCDISGMTARSPDFAELLYMMWWINNGLLIFNLLPIYPLDGGQILRSLLWLRLSAGRSLQIATVIGLIAIPALAIYGLRKFPRDMMMIALMAFFLGSQCFASFRRAQALRAVERMRRHDGFACPSCDQKPPIGALWLCAACGHRFDAFLTRAACPHCRTVLPAIGCVECGAQKPIEAWDLPRSRSAGDSPVIDV